MNPISFRNKTDIAGVVVMTFALFGFLGNIGIDYNWGTGIPSYIAMGYTLTLGRVIPLVLGFYGVETGLYLLLFLLSFLILNRGESRGRNLLQTIRLAGTVIVLFELGLWYFVPYFMDKWVIAAVAGTPLAAFTNWDLLGLGATLLVMTQGLLLVTKSEPKIEIP
ncbi:MAG: hypothetical protein JRN68_08560 [Nitrososphaerota archaeon]|nr:hypothetical protein [Nitrososphaerota archaeon]MDG6934737.1 hypothetical protein [Nitrososphaerota archaeon]MDG6990744.1 hypothetical protein [Nitrososphaerota archaeon]